jgi:hypothetical protein
MMINYLPFEPITLKYEIHKNIPSFLSCPTFCLAITATFGFEKQKGDSNNNKGKQQTGKRPDEVRRGTWRYLSAQI